MNYYFSHILAINSTAETDRLNAFLQIHLSLSHPTYSIEKHFVADAINSFAQMPT